jgi:hypothetical protein
MMIYIYIYHTVLKSAIICHACVPFPWWRYLPLQTLHEKVEESRIASQASDRPAIPNKADSQELGSLSHWQQAPDGPARCPHPRICAL